jgi:hypothetical protein
MTLICVVPEGEGLTVDVLLQATTTRAMAARKNNVKIDCGTPPKQFFKNERFMESSGYLYAEMSRANAAESEAGFFSGKYAFDWLVAA